MLAGSILMNTTMLTTIFIQVSTGLAVVLPIILELQSGSPDQDTEGVSCLSWEDCQAICNSTLS